MKKLKDIIFRGFGPTPNRQTPPVCYFSCAFIHRFLLWPRILIDNIYVLKGPLHERPQSVSTLHFAFIDLNERETWRQHVSCHCEIETFLSCGHRVALKTRRSYNSHLTKGYKKSRALLKFGSRHIFSDGWYNI